jgi:glycosyltransferase involved in cell wall biosynthesis
MSVQNTSAMSDRAYRPGDWSVLILSRHEPMAASSRLRTHQFIPALQAAGATVETSAFFDETYLQALYRSGGRRAADVARAYARRFRALRKVRKASVVWVEKEVFPYLPGGVEALLPRMGIPYVVDYDDATFHLYDRHRMPIVRRLLAGKFDPLLGGAETVTVGNAYLHDYVAAHGAQRVVRVPTVLDIDRYAVLPEPDDTEFRIGWIGSPGNTGLLTQLFGALRAVHTRRRLRLVTIGAGSLPDIGVPVEQHAWSEELEAHLLSTLHIGVMPLPDGPFERGKCGYKLIQYMACGRGVVASPVGVNAEMVTPDIGFLAATESDWIAAFDRLAGDRELRQAMGAAGRLRAETQYSLQGMAPRIVSLLAEAARGRPA